jgi:hypothetical protein
MLKQWTSTSPILIHQTQHAYLLYTTHDLLQDSFESKKYFAQVDIIDIVQKPYGNKALSDLFTLPSLQMNIFSCRSNNESVCFFILFQYTVHM